MSEQKRACGKCGKSVTIPEGDVAALCDAVGAPLCDKCFDDWRAKAETNRPPAPIVTQRPTKYLFTPDMGEISGFGGGYEQTCRNMLAAGMEWLDEHPSANPCFKGFKNVYGVVFDENDDAKALSAAVVAGSGDDCTGAMHQAVVSHCLAIRKNGWDWYCGEMRKPDDEAPR